MEVNVGLRMMGGGVCGGVRVGGRGVSGSILISASVSVLVMRTGAPSAVRIALASEAVK